MGDIKEKRKLENEKNYNFITDGKIIPSMIKLSLPIMISQLMQTLYNLADTLWVGKLGSNAVASISISFPIVFLMVSIAAGLTIAGTSLIAQYKGAKNEEMIEQTLGQIVTVVGSLALIISITGYLFSSNIIKYMGADNSIIKDSSDYLKIIFAGMPFMFCFFIFSSSLRGIGDTKTPMKMMVSSVILNIILDPIFIFGFGFINPLGVKGAALATIISRAVVTFYAIYILLKGSKGLKLNPLYLKPNKKIIRKIILIGIPSSVEQSMMALGQIFMTSLVAYFGTITVASYGIVNRIVSLPIILAFGISTSATTMVGQNIGAKKEQRAKSIANISLLTVFITLSIIGIICILDSTKIIMLFNNEKEVLNLGSRYLNISSLTFGFIGLMNVSNGIFKGSGRTIPPMVISITSLWLFRVFLGFLLSRIFDFEQDGIWYAIALSNIIGAVIAIFWLRFSNWTKGII